MNLPQGADPAQHAPDAAQLARELATARRRLDRLQGLAEERAKSYEETRAQREQALLFLELAPRSEALLEELSTSLFGEILDDVEANLSHALREILGQELSVRSKREIKGNRLHVTLYMESPQGEEDILVGQGGSVCNILSVGLRCIALSRLDPNIHRPFLVLDEQDCWLKPELVPAFMKLLKRIATALELQVLVISHHPLDLFATHAQRILELKPSRTGGAKVTLLRDVTPQAGETHPSSQSPRNLSTG